MSAVWLEDITQTPIRYNNTDPTENFHTPKKGTRWACGSCRLNLEGKYKKLFPKGLCPGCGTTMSFNDEVLEKEKVPHRVEFNSSYSRVPRVYDCKCMKGTIEDWDKGICPACIKKNRKWWQLDIYPFS